MKLTKAGRKALVNQIKKGDYSQDQGVYQLDMVSLIGWMIWYRVGNTFEVILGLNTVDGGSINLPVGKWDGWLIKRALKKYCK